MCIRGGGKTLMHKMLIKNMFFFNPSLRRILIKLKNMQILSLQVKLTVKLLKSLSTKAKDEKKAQSVFSLTI